MKNAFRKMELQADSLLAIIDTRANAQLGVTGTAAVIAGYCYAPDITEAFTTLLFDWVATIILPKDKLNIPEGIYDLVMKDGRLYACREEESYPLPDGPVAVEVLALEED